MIDRLLTFDEAEAVGLDGTGRDLDPRFPYHLSDLPDAWCDCGHRPDSHQTGVGAYTGWCFGILSTTRDYYDAIPEGSDPHEPCKCEAPTYLSMEGIL